MVQRDRHIGERSLAVNNVGSISSCGISTVSYHDGYTVTVPNTYAWISFFTSHVQPIWYDRLDESSAHVMHVPGMSFVIDETIHSGV